MTTENTTITALAGDYEGLRITVANLGYGKLTVGRVKQELRDVFDLAPYSIECGVREDVRSSAPDRFTTNARWWVKGNPDDVVTDLPGAAFDEDNDLCDTTPLAEVLREWQRYPSDTVRVVLDLYVYADPRSGRVLLGNAELEREADGQWLLTWID